MELSLADLKKIRSSDNHLVFGYCRQAHKVLLQKDDPYYDIQPLIIYTCLAFYYFKHEWDTDFIKDVGIVNGDCIKNIAYGHRTSFLKETISDGVHEYKFKIIHYRRDLLFYDVGIGIISSEYDIKSLMNDCFTYNHPGYCYYVSRGRREHNSVDYPYAVKCELNDIVTMTVDLKERELRYKVNDTNYGIAFHDIPNTSYRIAVYQFDKDVETQILQ